MKILLYCLNYAPELTGIGKYTGEQAEWLAAKGYDVRVITAPPYYPAWKVDPAYRGLRFRREMRNGVDVMRAPLWVPERPTGLRRIIHLASFALTSMVWLARQVKWRPDVVFIVEPPLFCSPAALLFARATGAKAWLHIHDYEIDAAFELGLLKGRLLRRMANALERFVLTRFDHVSSISNAMVALARRKGASDAHLTMLPNWVDLQGLARRSNADYRQQLGIPADAVVALYSGTIGAKQGIEILAEAAHRLRDRPDLHFVFCGAGAGVPDLRARCAGLSRIHFLPLQPWEDFSALLASADIHLMPQRADAADLVLPSKLAAMLASGKPVVATAAPATELGKLVMQCGIVVEPGDSAALADAIVELADDPQRGHALGAAGKAWAEGHLDRDAVLGTFEATLIRLHAETPLSAPATADYAGD
ncbi:glycosyltransferase WbuB [Cupriavidus pauculus]|uniref:Colanic acid biosynthesis glycosyltransferase WcaI n=1 Tax=Cupriavidus pauculus TaxID=82633 RepID=A0A3G8H6N7_9BURK|nr:glycosyltransferase WbuB [Cupriavidus pauculus]AZG16086.1 colanic acid biosynthesis glycosyltransferase WcaI [Cupriavidus pauculus]